MSTVMDNLEEVLEAIVESADDNGLWSVFTANKGKEAFMKIGYNEDDAMGMIRDLYFYAVLSPEEERRLDEITLEKFCEVLGE
jgi:hypothetical protein